MSSQTIGLIMLVRDEADLLASNLRFHYNQGFDHFAVMDNASNDGTREQLERLAKTLPITVVDQPDLSFRQAEWITKLARTLEKIGIDWSISIDADEFLESGNGALKKNLSEIDYPILIDRQNVLPRASALRLPTYHQLMDASLRVRRPIGSYPFAAPDLQANFQFTLRNLPGKVLFPLKGLKEILPGSHFVEHRLPTRQPPFNLLIRHYPVRRFDQFMKRLDHWEERFRLNPPVDGVSQHIRRWLHLRSQGRIESEYNTFAISDVKVNSYLECGTLIEDLLGKEQF